LALKYTIYINLEFIKHLNLLLSEEEKKERKELIIEIIVKRIKIKIKIFRLGFYWRFLRFILKTLITLICEIIAPLYCIKNNIIESGTA
jgi:hypothetical protein